MISSVRRVVRESAVRNALTVAASLAAWTLGSYVFYVLAGRLLGPDDYGLAASLQAFIVVVAVPIVALQWAAARLAATSPPGQVRSVYRRTTLAACAVSVGVASLASVATMLVAAGRPGLPVGPLVATFWALTPVVPMFLLLGVLQGRHRYGAFSWSYAASGVLRAPALLALLALPFMTPVVGTVLATGIPYAIAAVMAAWISRRMLRRGERATASTWHTFRSGVVAAGLGLAGIAALTNVDVIAGRLHLSPSEAGYFGAAAVIAKVLMLVPQALTVVLLPRVAESRSGSRPTGHLLAAGVAVTLGTGLIATLGAIYFSGQIVTLTFGSEYAPASGLIMPFFAATTLLGALLILVNHHVARSDHRFSWVACALAALQIALLGAVGDSAGSIILIDASVAAAGLIAHEIIYFRTSDSIVRGFVELTGTALGRMLPGAANRTRGRGTPEDEV